MNAQSIDQVCDRIHNVYGVRVTDMFLDNRNKRGSKLEAAVIDRLDAAREDGREATAADVRDVVAVVELWQSQD